MLSSDDELELFLWRLGAFVYEKRTRDTRGATHMLAVRPPGVEADIAPTWLVSDATAHAHTEHKRVAAVNAPGHGQAVTATRRGPAAQGEADTAPRGGGRGRWNTRGGGMAH